MDSLITALREENERLRARVKELEALLTPESVRIDEAWGLVRAEKRVFAALASRDRVSKEHLYDALYGDRIDLDNPPPIACVESHVSKMRRKLRPFGIEVTARRFEGYALVDRHRFLAAPAGAA